MLLMLRLEAFDDAGVIASGASCSPASFSTCSASDLFSLLDSVDLSEQIESFFAFFWWFEGGGRGERWDGNCQTLFDKAKAPTPLFQRFYHDVEESTSLLPLILSLPFRFTVITPTPFSCYYSAVAACSLAANDSRELCRIPRIPISTQKSSIDYPDCITSDKDGLSGKSRRTRRGPGGKKDAEGQIPFPLHGERCLQTVLDVTARRKVLGSLWKITSSVCEAESVFEEEQISERASWERFSIGSQRDLLTSETHFFRHLSLEWRSVCSQNRIIMA